MSRATVPDVAPFHFRDCDQRCYGSCTAELRKGNDGVLGQYDRDCWAVDAWSLATVFVGDPCDPSTWRRVTKPSTAAAVDAPTMECRHFLPLTEWCPDCNPPANEPDYEVVPLW